MSQPSASNPRSTRSNPLQTGLIQTGTLQTGLIQTGFLLAFLLLCAASATARTRPHYGGQIRVATDGDPMQKPSGFTPAGLAWALTLESLTRIDPAGSPIPALSDHWSSDANQTRWQFHLRPGVSFHDGTPLTAIAVIASLNESCRTAPCPWSSSSSSSGPSSSPNATNPTGLHALGASIVITTSTPTPALPALLAQDRFRIATHPSVNSEDSSSPAIPIGTGPFRFTRIASGTVTLSANEESWQGRPYLDTIELSARPSAGSPDTHSYDLAALRPSELRQAAQQHASVLTQPSTTLLYLQIREDSLNPQLRAAAALALDRNALQQVIFQRQAEVTASLLPNAISGLSFLFPTDRELARSQTLRAGATPPPLTIAAENSETMQLAAARIALNLHDAGFNVRVLQPLKDPRLPNADLTLRTLPIPTGDPSLALTAILQQLNQAGISQTSTSQAGPSAAYQAEQEFLDRHTILPLLFLPRAWTNSPRLRDLELNFDGTPNLANASLQSELPAAGAGDAP